MGGIEHFSHHDQKYFLFIKSKYSTLVEKKSKHFGSNNEMLKKKMKTNNTIKT